LEEVMEPTPMTVGTAADPHDSCKRAMGDEVESRRMFIETNAKFVSNLDV
jgi:DNA gyrase/topoisomerase IV subunit B